MQGIMLVNNWTRDVNDILDKIRINSIVLSNEHKKTYFLLSSRIKWFRVPVIFLSALGSVFGIGLSPYLPQLLISEICSAMSLVVGLIGSIELFLAISTKMESELVQSKELYLLAIEIQKTLLLDMENRNGDGMAYLEDKFNVYSKLIENSYLLECKIMDELTPLPSELHTKISANQSWDTPPRKMSMLARTNNLFGTNRRKTPHRQVAPLPNLSPLSSDTNKPAPEERTNDLRYSFSRRKVSPAFDTKATATLPPWFSSSKNSNHLPLGRRRSLLPPPSDDLLPRPMTHTIHRPGSVKEPRSMIVSRRSLVRMVSSEPPMHPPPRRHETPITIPPFNLAQLKFPDDDQRTMQEPPPPALLSPIRRCATSESKPKTRIPRTYSYIDLQKDPDPRFVRDLVVDDELDRDAQRRIQRALLAVTPFISNNVSPTESFQKCM